MSQLKGIRRHALIYGIGTLATKAVSFVMLPIYTRFLTPADYGVMELIGMALDVLSIIAGAELVQGIFRFYHKTDDEQERRRVVSTALLALGASYGALGAIGAIGAPLLSRLVFRTEDHVALIRLASMTLGLQGALMVPLTYARLRDYSMLFVAGNLVRLGLQLGLNVLFVVVLRTGVTGIYWSNLIATTIVTAGLVVWLVRDVGLRPDWSITRHLTRYGFPLVLTNAATFLVAFGDRFFIQRSHGEGEVGRYALVYQFGFLLLSFGYAPFAAAWETRRFALATDESRDRQYAEAFFLANLLLLPVAVVLAFSVPPALRLIATEGFLLPPVVTVLVLAAYVLHGWSHMHEIGILLSERTRLLALANWASAGVALATYALLIPRFAATGAALATLLTMGVRYGAIYVMAQRETRIRWNWARQGPLVGVSAAALAAAAAVPDALPLHTTIVLRFGCLLAYAGVVWQPFVIGEATRDVVLTAIRSRWTRVAAALR